MRDKTPSSADRLGCMAGSCCGCPAALTRRQFLATTATATAGALLAGATADADVTRAAAARAAATRDKIRIRIVYSLHAERQAGPDWPNVGFDFVPVMEPHQRGADESLPGVRVPAVAGDRRGAGEEDPRGGQGGRRRRLPRLPDELLEPRGADDRRPPASRCSTPTSSSAAAAGSSSTRRRSCAAQRAERRLRRLVADRGSGRGGEVLRGREEGRLAGGVRRGDRAGCALARTPGRRGTARRQARPGDGIADRRLRPAAAGSRRSWPCAARSRARPARAWASRWSTCAFAELNDAWKAADKDESRAIADRWQKTGGENRRRVARDARDVGGHVPGDEGRAEEARRQRHHHQLPRRILRRPHSRLSVPGLPRTEQRGAGRRLRVRRALDGDDGGGRRS